MYKIGILIPCYNVQISIKDVLTSLSDKVLKNIDTVLAVDNCSTDNTLQTLNKIKSSKSNVGKKLVIIKNSQNYGLGGSQKIGYRYFIENLKFRIPITKQNISIIFSQICDFFKF